MPSDLTKTKQIDFYDGQVSFNIPLDWHEEYNSQEISGTFYRDGDAQSSGTFRLYLIMLKPPAPIEKKDVVKVLNAANLLNEGILFLPNGNAYQKHIKKTIETGINITIHHWSLANVKVPDLARIANFSYTVLTQLENEEWVKNEIEFLNQQIELAVFK